MHLQFVKFQPQKLIESLQIKLEFEWLGIDLKVFHSLKLRSIWILHSISRHIEEKRVGKALDFWLLQETNLSTDIHVMINVLCRLYMRCECACDSCFEQITEAMFTKVQRCSFFNLNFSHSWCRPTFSILCFANGVFQHISWLYF